jgi:hypothetical protein
MDLKTVPHSILQHCTAFVAGSSSSSTVVQNFITHKPSKLYRTSYVKTVAGAADLASRQALLDCRLRLQTMPRMYFNPFWATHPPCLYCLKMHYTYCSMLKYKWCNGERAQAHDTALYCSLPGCTAQILKAKPQWCRQDGSRLMSTGS